MLYYGAAYYPEQETPETIREDLGRLKDLGFNVVRVGEFAWTKMEPRDGVFDFAWLDDMVDQFGREGVHTLLCTPTANPPLWMVKKHPDILYVDHRGVTRPFGARRHYCYNVPVYRDYCRRMAEQIGRRYGRSPYVVGLHLDNEMAQEATGRCHCDVCRTKFRGWMKRKYETIEALNERAGTVFWSAQYDAFDDVRPPLRTTESTKDAQVITDFFDNPTLRLDWERFCSDSMIEFLAVQADELRKHSKLPLTTNGTGMGTNGLDYYKTFGALDIAAGDIYPSVRTDSMYGTTTDYALHRVYKGTQTSG